MVKNRKDDVFLSGPMPSHHDGFILGNGDLGALMYGNQSELKFMFGKNDCWDARYGSNPEADILTQDDLITLIEHYGLEDLQRLTPTQNSQITLPISKRPIPANIRVIYQTPEYWLKKEYFRPCPKRVGELVFMGPGLSTTKMKSRLRIMEGIFEVEFEYNPNAKVRLEGFIWAEGNIFCLRYQVQGEVSSPLLILRKWPDAVDDSIPDPILEFPPPGDVVVISQAIPGDEDTKPFQWSMAGKLPGSRMDQRYETIVALPYKNATTDYFIAVVTSRDEKRVKPSTRAHEIVEYASKVGYDALKASHQEWWSNFWSRSSVTLEDKDLEKVWYRELYKAACYIKEGKQAPGLYGNMIIYDGCMWHGNYHMNHNFQKSFYPVLVTNHCEMSEPYIQAILDYLPEAEWLAKKIFGLEGAYFDLIIIPFLPPHKQNVNNHYGRSLALSGWAIGQFWRYYLYTKDREWLKVKGYPAIKKVAQFYWNYLEKYQKQLDGDIYPSVCGEGIGWKRNPVRDLACIRFAFRAAIKASEELGVDNNWRERWKEGLRRVPKYSVVNIGGEQFIAQFKGQTDKDLVGRKLSRRSFSGDAAFTIFPGEDLNPESNSKYVDMAKRALNALADEKDAEIDIYTEGIAMARLRLERTYECLRKVAIRCRYANGMPSSFNIKDNGIPGVYGLYFYPIPAEDVNMSLVISELLLQSYGGVIRLFPAWPKKKSASFETLRAEGGFLVSSTLKNGKIGPTKIQSTAGGTCQIQWPWGKVTIRCEESGEEVQYALEQNIISFETTPGNNYEIYSYSM